MKLTTAFSILLVAASHSNIAPRIWSESEPLPTPTAAAIERREISAQYSPILYVADLQASVDFYRRVLGFRFVEFSRGRLPQTEPPHSAIMEAFGQRIVLTTGGEVDSLQSKGMRHHFSMDKIEYVEMLYDHVVAEGAEVGCHAPAKDGTIVIFCVTDPDGHHIVFGPPRRKGPS